MKCCSYQYMFNLLQWNADCGDIWSAANESLTAMTCVWSVADEVLIAVTYMYMFPQDEHSLLPQPDEVLLCTENTTFEQVCLSFCVMCTLVFSCFVYLKAILKDCIHLFEADNWCVLPMCSWLWQKLSCWLFLRVCLREIFMFSFQFGWPWSVFMVTVTRTAGDAGLCCVPYYTLNVFQIVLIPFVC